MVLQVRHSTPKKDAITQQALDPWVRELLGSTCCNAARTDARGQWGWMVNSLIALKYLASCRDDEQGPLQRAMPPALVAVSGLRRGQAMEPTLSPTAAPPTRDSSVDTHDGSAMPATARGAQQRWPETDPNQPSGPLALTSDPSLDVPVIASPEEVFRARELREQLRKKYLNRPSHPYSRWCVGVE